MKNSHNIPEIKIIISSQPFSFLNNYTNNEEYDDDDDEKYDKDGYYDANGRLIRTKRNGNGNNKNKRSENFEIIKKFPVEFTYSPRTTDLKRPRPDLEQPQIAAT